MPGRAVGLDGGRCRPVNTPMRYAVFSDIHGNLEALEAVLEALSREAVDSFLCAGDIVGYGADPAECIRRFREIGGISVMGNHDWAVLTPADAVDFNPAARAAVAWTRRRLGDRDLDFLRRLPLTLENDDLVLAHGTLDHPGDFHYLDDLGMASETFRLQEKRICFVGHTHVPGIIVQARGDIRCLGGLSVGLDQAEKFIVNPGSVGQPRDGNPQAAYSIYDVAARRVDIKRVPYPVAEAQRKIIAAGLPSMLAERLGAGI